MYDVIVVGGGIAGLSAALILGRSLRRVLVCEAGRPRNAASPALHGLLGHDGVAPLELLRVARGQLRRYDSVELRTAEVRDCRRVEGGYEAALAGGGRAQGRAVLVATGLTDDLPRLRGAEERFARGVYHCPYCDGWEVREQPLAAFGCGHAAAGLALELTVWSDDVVLLSDGPAELSEKDRRRLVSNGVGVDERRIERLEGDGRLERVRFAGGGALERAALFYVPAWQEKSDLAARLGCRMDRHGLAEAGRAAETNVPGVWVAGDASSGLQLAAVASSEGARAAVAINTWLLKQDLAAREAAARSRA